MNSELLDKNGTEIKIGDKIRFCERDGNTWEGVCTFEEGVFTVDILECKQISNPKNWSQEHDWIESRWWAVTIGYGEFGTWDCPRKPLSQIAERFSSYDEVRPLYHKFGFKKRILNCEIVNE